MSKFVLGISYEATKALVQAVAHNKDVEVFRFIDTNKVEVTCVDRDFWLYWNGSYWQSSQPE